MPEHTSHDSEAITLLAENVGEIREAVTELKEERVTLEASRAVLDAAIKGLGALRSQVLENDIGKLQLALNDKTRELAQEISRFEAAVAEIDRRAEAGDDALKQQLAAESKQLHAEAAALRTQLAAYQEWGSKVELSLKEHAEKLAAIPATIQGAEGRSPNPRGKYESGVKYARLDIAEIAGSSYISAEDDNDEKPSPNSKKWKLLARRGGGGGFGGNQIEEAAQYAANAAAQVVLASEQATAAEASADAAAISATAAANAIAAQFKGGIAGASVPVTSTSAGDYYRITAAGSAQSKTWSVGDLAVYNGTSGSWTQMAGIRANPGVGAPRPMLYFDGLTSGTLVTVANQAAIGTLPFSFETWMCPEDLSAIRPILGGVTNAPSWRLETDGRLLMTKQNAATVGYSIGTVSAGTLTHVAYTRDSSNVGTFYINAISAGTITDATDYTVALNQIGTLSTGTVAFKGLLAPANIYNYAISAAQVSALFYNGAPDPIDIYGLGANQVGIDSTSLAGNTVRRKRYRIVTAGNTDFTAIGAANSNVGTEFIATGVGTGTGTVKALGLVLCPSTNVIQAGESWADVSGKGATISWYGATHVQWAEPLSPLGDPSATSRLILYGDSLTARDYSPYIVTSYSGFSIYVRGVGGRTLLNMIERAPAEVIPLRANSARHNVVVVWGGTNDAALGATAAQALERTAALCTLLRINGFKVVIMPMISRTTLEAFKNSLNALLAQSWTLFADALVPATNANLFADDACNNTTYFESDKVHLTTTGEAVVGGIVSAAIDLVTSPLIHAEGAGSPEGVLTAPVGSTYRRRDGGSGTTWYVKESDGTGSTGWVGK